MSHQPSAEGTWVVEENGRMLYMVSEDEHTLEIEPEALSDPDKFFYLRSMPEYNPIDFLDKWIKALEIVGKTEIKITLSK